MTKNIDLEIAHKAQLKDIREIAAAIGLNEDHLETYGKYKAKTDYNLLQEPTENKPKLVLVTAINPTPAGEGKTTVMIGLADALSADGKQTIAAMREPSMGPVFGVKGGATGGGYAQVGPMEDINLHFTGDMHAISSANNLLAAMIDNHMYQGNALELDPKRITWKRCLDMNDRQLRELVSGMGRPVDGVMRSDGFDITAASETMAAFCMATDLMDLRTRLGCMVIGYNVDGEPVTASQLHAEGAMAALLKDALKPNLVQTLEGTPAFIHGGPFANIAHGCNSVIATRMALHMAKDYVITEAGFGADLGAEKFFDIKCRAAGFRPDAVVIVATIRALKYNGGADKDELGVQDLQALRRGLPNLIKHIENITHAFGLPAVVALNRFPDDTQEEIQLVSEACEALGTQVCVTEVWAKGSKGAQTLAAAVEEACVRPNRFDYLYDTDMSIEEKVVTVAKKIYGAKHVVFSFEAEQKIKKLEEQGFSTMPVCIAKTQYSLSDDPQKLGRPENFVMTVRDAQVSAGAGFVVCMTGSIVKMPGLSAKPAALGIDVDKNGCISGLF